MTHILKYLYVDKCAVFWSQKNIVRALWIITESEKETKILKLDETVTSKMRNLDYVI